MIASVGTFSNHYTKDCINVNIESDGLDKFQKLLISLSIITMYKLVLKSLVNIIYKNI